MFRVVVAVAAQKTGASFLSPKKIVTEMVSSMLWSDVPSRFFLSVTLTRCASFQFSSLEICRGGLP